MIIRILFVLLYSINCFAQSAGKLNQDTIFAGTPAPRNYVKNPSAIKNALNVTTSNAAVARDTDTADKLDGIASFTCDASAQNGYCAWATETIQEGDKTGNCEAKMQYKGDASLYKFAITDTTNYLSYSSLLTNATDWTSVSINYPCGSTRDVRLVQTESGTGAAVNIGRIYYGSATNVSVANVTTEWTGYTPTLTNVTIGNGSTTFYWRRVGDSIEVKGVIVFGSTTSVSSNIYVSFPTGITISSIDSNKRVGTVEIYDSGERENYFVYVDGSNNRFAFGGMTNAGTQGYGNATFPVTFGTGDEIHYWNVTAKVVGWGSQQAVAANTTPWYVDATIGGANPNLTTSAKTSWTSIEDGSLTLVNSTGAATAWIPCASGTSPSGLSCSAANESLGIYVNIPTAGTYMVCATALHYLQITNGSQETYLRLVETSASDPTSQTQVGTAATASRAAFAGTNEDAIYPHHNCSEFSFSSNGYKTIRLMYKQLVAGGTVSSNNILADRTANQGSREVKFSMWPITQQMPMPLLVGSVSSNTTAMERIERAIISCSSGSSITSQSGSWISSVGNISSNRCSVTIASGIFSATPTCQVQVKTSSTTFTISSNVSVNSATSLDVGCVYNTGATTTACTGGPDIFHITCMGPR